MNRYKNLIAALVLASAVATGFAVGYSATPEAPAAAAPLDKDTAFLTFLRAKDVGTTSNADALEMGRRVAVALRDEHVNPWMEGTRLVTLGYTGDEAATIVGATIAVYVPELSSLVE